MIQTLGKWPGTRPVQLQLRRQGEGRQEMLDPSARRGVHSCAAGASPFLPQWPALPARLCCPKEDEGRGRPGWGKMN